jgi:hypothetical protein
MLAVLFLPGGMVTPGRAADWSDIISFNDPTNGAARQNSILLFYGRLSTTNLGSTLVFNEFPLGTTAITGQKYDNFIAGGAYQRDVFRYGGAVIAGEIGIADRFGHYQDCCIPSSPTIYVAHDVNSGEIWAGPAFRYESIVLFNQLRVIPGVTGGLSAVTSSIGTELDRVQSRNGDGTLLFYLGLEVAFSFVELPALEFVVEDHHRSGAQNTLGHMAEGYNANVMGFRYRF